jgi:hypothetical protein
VLNTKSAISTEIVIHGIGQNLERRPVEYAADRFVSD